VGAERRPQVGSVSLSLADIKVKERDESVGSRKFSPNDGRRKPGRVEEKPKIATSSAVV